MSPVRCLAGTAVLLIAATSAQAQVKLQLKHPEGQKITTEHSMKLDQVTTVMGMDINTNVEQVTTTSTTFGKPREDGTIPIENKVEALKANINTPLGTLSYDSTSSNNPEPDAEQLKPAVDVIKARLGTSYTVVLDKDGKVKAVEGLEKILEKIVAANPEAGEQAKSSLNAETMITNESEHYARFPDTLLRDGESWTRSEVMDLGGNQTLTFEKRYEYQGTVDKDGKKLDKIGSKTTGVKFALGANSAIPAKVTASDLKIDSSEGTILFDREQGRVVDLSDTNKMKGAITLEVQGMEIEMQIDLTIAETQHAK